MFDFSRTFRGVNTDFFFNFSDIFLISPTSDPSDFLLNRAVRAVPYDHNQDHPIIFISILIPLHDFNVCANIIQRPAFDTVKGK